MKIRILENFLTLNTVYIHYICKRIYFRCYFMLIFLYFGNFNKLMMCIQLKRNAILCDSNRKANTSVSSLVSVNVWSVLFLFTGCVDQKKKKLNTLVTFNRDDQNDVALRLLWHSAVAFFQLHRWMFKCTHIRYT